MSQKQNFIKLPFEFNVKKLIEDLDCVESFDWVNHPNMSAYDGSWLITSLTSIDGKTKQIVAVENQDYINTPLLQKMKYIKDIINRFQTKVEAVRFMKLGANSIIKTHRDRGSHYNDGLARIHIPITTNKSVEFILNGQKTKMDVGKCYYIDADAPHSVVNNGDSDRVHLLIDCHINDWFKTIFKEAGYIEKKYKYSNKNINDDNVDEIIKSLISINTDTSLALARNLKQ